MHAQRTCFFRSMVIVQFIIIVILILFSAFFSSSETALTTITPHRLKMMVEENVPHAKTLEKVLNKRSKMLSVILICNNIVNLAASALMTVAVQTLVGDFAVGLGTGVLTVLILIFGEVAPKTMATYRAEKIGLFVAPIIWVLMIVFTPIAAAINFLSTGVIRLFGIRKNEKSESYTENEIRSIVEVSHEEGVTTSEERLYINNVYDFTDTPVKEVMVPRINVTAVSLEATYQEIMEIFKEDYFTRLPVFDEEKKNFVGILNMKDVFLFNQEKTENFRVADIMREANYTYDGKKLPELLKEMKVSGDNMMVVMDEYGQSVGIVTLEDLLEELVGDIRDEYDKNEDEEFEQVGEREYLIAGKISLDDINDRIGTTLDSENYDSIGGLLIEELGRLPVEGDTIQVGPVTICAEHVDKNKIESVRLTIEEPAEEE